MDANIYHFAQDEKKMAKNINMAMIFNERNSTVTSNGSITLQIKKVQNLNRNVILIFTYILPKKKEPIKEKAFGDTLQ